MNPLADASAWVIPVILAVTLHEAAHGYAARAFGDDTAARMGRITLNPLKHIDRFGTLLLPGLLLLAHSPVLFGYAKPVPVNFRALKPARLGMIAVALAGPGMNIMLAFVSALLLHLDHWLTPEAAPWFYMNLYRAILLNAALAVFNVLPLPPLDGSRVLSALLPGNAARAFGRMERFGMLLIFMLLLLVPWFGESVSAAVSVVVETVLHATGNAVDY